MYYLISGLIGYLFGCFNPATIIAKRKGVDLRSSGSGNPGGTNTMLVVGPKYGFLVMILDALKAVAAARIARWLFPKLVYAGLAAALGAIIGHVWPVFLGFRGGKGLASYFGMTLALNWKLALIVGAVIVLATLLTDFISVGALSSIVVAPAYTFFTTHNPVLVAILCVASLVMFFKHWENILRITKGQEIGLRRTAKGADRIDK